LKRIRDEHDCVGGKFSFTVTLEISLIISFHVVIILCIRTNGWSHTRNTKVAERATSTIGRYAIETALVTPQVQKFTRNCCTA